jgi:RHH-type proline utilization regulon transcriptional repressor/proline dehydrogenase/delta 1-pyrroline-5-carboxylate dehydrogenase
MESAVALIGQEPEARVIDLEGSQDERVALEPAIQEIGLQLDRRMRRPRTPREWLDHRMMRWAGQRADVRAALFRFIDVAPACQTLDEAGSHLHGFLSELEHPPTSLALADWAARHGVLRRLAGAAGLAGTRRLGRRFIVASDAQAAIRPLAKLWRAGVCNSLDLLGEATVSEQEAERYAARCRSALDCLARSGRRWPAQPLLAFDSVGRLSRAHLSIKLSALTADLRPDAPERGVASARDRLRHLLREARELGAHIHVDMESLDHRETVTQSVFEVLSAPEFRDGPSVGLVLQAYLRDSGDQLTQILDWAGSHPRHPPLLVRLVKGAYWDYELVEAAQAGWAPPVYLDRADCDRNFERLTRRLLDAYPLVRSAIASHNLRSVAHALAYQRSRGLAPGDVEYQVLRGLGEEMGAGLVRTGVRVRVYCPVGDLVAGMAYLVRRMLENTSNDSFLRARAEGEDPAVLLEAP